VGNSEKIDVTIMMPCLNEERTLPTCIDWAKEALRDLKDKYGLSGEVLISDNGSTDRSIEIAEKLGCRVVHCLVKGYGNALIYGGRNALGKYIVMGDADASYDFRESVAMVETLLEGYELCMGNRFTGKIELGAMPWKNKFIGNPALSGVLNLFFHSRLGDAHSGLRAFTKEAFHKMRLMSPGMEFASEIVVKAALMDLKRTEIPITLHKDGRDRPPHLNPLRDGWRHLKCLVMFSPLWLYFIPSLLMMLISIAVFGILFSTERGAVFSFGPFWIGDHWMILSGGLFIMSFSMIIFGLVALAYSVKEHCRVLSPALKKLYDLLTVENSLLFGSVLCIGGILLLVYVFADWSGKGFGGLSRIREMVLITVLLVTGLQAMLGGFLISIVKDENDILALYDAEYATSGDVEKEQ
jgi:glycosyltransferase involved in cell wall biosynthesis